MGSRNTKLKRGSRGDTPQGRSSFDGFMSMSRGYLKHMMEGLDPVEIIDLLAEIVEKQDQYPNSIDGRREYLMERKENIEDKLEQLERAEKQY
ncbi:MAG: hypothetical protein ABEJ95_01595 [Candidatus Nanohalobium sp.]